VVEENELAFVRRDGFPVTERHTLIIRKRHVADYFELTQPELNAVSQLMRRQRLSLLAALKEVEGFNVGVNVGASAGQTVMHCHIHMMPRRSGDVARAARGHTPRDPWQRHVLSKAGQLVEPRGDIRHVIPGKGVY
jgi:diadenosine tetraphosphate (Ap4A) HIT family hydrolase